MNKGKQQEPLNTTSIQMVNVQLPTVEVRYENVTVEEKCYIGNRALPTLLNTARNIVESTLEIVLKEQTSLFSKMMTLLLGPPSSGKTTLCYLLDVMNFTNFIFIKQMKGEVTYNGHKFDEFVPQKTSAYISQNDIHLPEMTVKESLDFSARCQGVGSRYGLETTLFPEAEVNLFMKACAVQGLETTSKQIILLKSRQHHSQTKKLKISSGEMIVGPTKTLFMDEISTGVDSSTTYQIVKCLQQIAHLTEATILMSLLQPAPQTFDLFDDIILLSDGQIIYQGPRDHVLEFFEICGFRCPERKSTADFLQEVTSRKDQENYWADKSKPYRYISVTEFANKFNDFHVGNSLRNELSNPFNKNNSHKSALVFTKYSLPKVQLLKANFAKEFCQIVFLAFVSSTVFLRTEHKDNNEENAGLYIGALLYPPWTFTLPTVILRIPISIFESLVWMVLTYYPIGYAPNTERFFLLQQMAAGAFRAIASVCRSMVIASTFGSLAILVLFMLGGFVLPHSLIPKWWSWGYWTSPLSYAFDALAINEMLAPRWMDRLASDNATAVGVAVLEKFDIFPQSNWFWIGSAALLGFAILFNCLFTIALTYLNPIGRPQAIIPEEKAHVVEVGMHKTSPRVAEMVTLQSRRNASRNGAPSALEEKNGITSKRGIVLPFVPLSMSFDNINYYVDMPAELKAKGETENRLQLLREVIGAFRPGILTALMGVSGAGKTTLMDVLAGRKTGGYTKGDIRISGFPKNQETFARISGYCEKNDIHSPQVTVRESLIYSAFLRLPKEVSDEEKMIFVEEVMELVELDTLKDAIVGIPGITGLSTEQRKRLTIAVELVANPSIIFMDEPTSGLDARAAAIVMRTARNTVNTGHGQLSAQFINLALLILMKMGGQVIYSGPLGRNSCRVIEYFEAIPGVPKIKDKYNPATWMLEASSNGSEARLGIDFAEYYKMSDLYQQNKLLVKELSTPSSRAKDLYFPTQYSQSTWGQFKSCLWKQWWTYWRSPEYNLARFFFSLTAALLLGSMFWMIGTKMNSSTDLNIVIGAMFFSILSIGITNCSTVVVEIPYAFVQAIYFAVIAYAMLGFEWTATKFLWFFFITFLTFLYFTYYGMMSVSITPNPQTAAILASSFYGFFNLFSGFFIPRSRIPKWWVWYYWICPVAWTVYGLILSQYGDLEDMIKVPGMEDQMIKAYIKEHYGYENGFMGVVAGVLVGFTIFFATMYAICIKFINFQHR
ncbi:hypothetical protein MKW98_028912 [Papaver atlanticum]|uniref:ABC transporter domain-containing protein n=1 Tax=Papaver atlanticum TaxID=357466 RepID=A0AAD4X8B9_9MAGN|nr:hypothetical protein MKW98_028912 [Papaver atlanticum]